MKDNSQSLTKNHEDLKFKDPVLVTKPLLPDLEKYNEYLERIWDKQWLTNNGPIVNEFKEKLKSKLKSDHVEVFSNGHSALEIAIQSLNLKGDVITTPFTFASTTHAITLNNLNPIFCDINRENYNIDVSLIEELITDDTSAILPVHVFGNPCDLKKIDKIAKKHDLKVIYDAAHCFGVEFDGIPISQFGDISMFSFHATKVFNSIEGGALTFNDSDLILKLKALKNFGITPEVETVDYIGQNAKMNEFEAAMGICNLELIGHAIEMRKNIYELYENNFKEVSAIKTIKIDPKVKSNYAYFTILLDSNQQRDFLFKKLHQSNVFVKKYFYPSANEFPVYNYDLNLSVSKKVSDCILSLPIYPDLSLDTVNKISELIILFLNEFEKFNV
ncbi:MAG: DegT/DnrJ/EryC1/StrS family aminotransferase [Methanobrevibacter sp.]|nr:DegT/DnrJ/EryC1/StrS family aminotransferase [Candidatus Methanoflexus mossambicus]